MAKSASSIAELARSIGVPEEKLSATIKRYNEHVEAGKDADHHRFGFGRDRMQMPFARAPKKIQRAPLYALPLFILTRKSLGGVRIDQSCRALDAKNRVVPGLYAVGEVTGFAGVNGSAGLEGTFIGPSILQGRIAGQFIASGAPRKVLQPVDRGMESEEVSVGTETNKECIGCHNLTARISTPRSGYWHFEQVHRMVLDQSFSCVGCHRELAPFRAGDHKISRTAQISSCVVCHVASARR
jgi:succinate dehydrogenase/fumarate reductase flavoprotein subunit